MISTIDKLLPLSHIKKFSTSPQTTSSSLLRDLEGGSGIRSASEGGEEGRRAFHGAVTSAGTTETPPLTSSESVASEESARFPPRVCFEPAAVWKPCRSVMAARGAREDGGRGSQTRIVELGAGMPVNERKKGAHGLFEAPLPRVCTRLFVLARYSPLLSFVYLTRLLFILTTACLCLAPFLSTNLTRI